MEVLTEKNIVVKDSLFDPNSKDQSTVYYYKGDDGRVRYKVWIFLDGLDTYYVDYVKYTLHPTFNERVKKVKRSIENPLSGLSIWTWGLFSVQLEIILKTGEKIITSHYLTYGKQLKEGLKYVDVRNE